MACVICGLGHQSHRHVHHQQKSLHNVLKKRGDWKNMRFYRVSEAY